MGFTARKRGPKGAIVRQAPPAADLIMPIDMDEDFSDVSAAPGNAYRLENPDPSRHYIWAHNDAADIQSYQAEVVPYRLEFYAGDDDKSAVRPRGCFGILAKGDRMVVQDHCLLSADRRLIEKRMRMRVVQGRQQYQGEKIARTRDTKLEFNNPGRVSAEMGGLGRYAGQDKTGQPGAR